MVDVENQLLNFANKTRIIFRMLWGSDAASCISVSGYKVCFPWRWVSCGPQSAQIVQSPSSEGLKTTQDKARSSHIWPWSWPYFRENPGFPSILDCPVAAGPWVMSGRRHKLNFFWFWMQLGTRYCSENPDIFSGISILLIQNDFP